MRLLQDMLSKWVHCCLKMRPKNLLRTTAFNSQAKINGLPLQTTTGFNWVTSITLLASCTANLDPLAGAQMPQSIHGATFSFGKMLKVPPMTKESLLISAKNKKVLIRYPLQKLCQRKYFWELLRFLNTKQRKNLFWLKRFFVITTSSRLWTTDQVLPFSLAAFITSKESTNQKVKPFKCSSTILIRMKSAKFLESFSMKKKMWKQKSNSSSNQNPTLPPQRKFS